MSDEKFGEDMEAYLEKDTANRQGKDLDEWLAIEVMGWNTCYDGNSFESFCPGYLNKNNWNPLTSLEQAFEVLEEYMDQNDDYFSLTYPKPNVWRANINFNAHGFGYVVRSENQANAIIGAICKSESKFEEFDEVFE